MNSTKHRRQIQFLLTMVLAIEDRVFLFEHVFREGNRYTDLVQEQFAEEFPQTPVPHRNAFRRLTVQFRETGSVLDAERSGRPSKLNEKMLMDISDSMLQSPSKSLHKLAQEKDIGLATAHKAVREKLNLFQYKVTAVQELKQAFHEKLIRYCECFTNFIQTKTAEILDVTFFRNEAWFHLSGYVNTQNTRLLSSEIPYAVHEKPLHDQKLGVWVAISRRRIVGPLFLTTATHAFIRNISHADLQKVFAKKIKRVQVCIDARGHHCQHIL
jgi:transposase